MRWIYISPHLDDAIWSAGGLMYEQKLAGDQVAVWTMPSGIPSSMPLSDFASRLHERWGVRSAKHAIEGRRAENAAAAALLGAETEEFDFLDCIYRRGPAGEALYEKVFVPPHAADADLPRQLAEAIAERLAPEDIPVFPLSIGGHVDHAIVRMAAGKVGRSVRYYADVPYLLNNRVQLFQETWWMEGELYKISAAGLNRWLEAIRAYASQLEAEFGGSVQMQAKISEYWAERKGILIWK
jgi:LmbE family N-acetylglucosaminyl deacetylase